MAGPLGALEGLVSNNLVKQILIWQVLGQIIEPILEPVTIPLRQELLKLHPGQVISVADAVDAYVKGHLTLEQVHDALAQSGIASDTADVLIATAGEPPGLQTLVEWTRRGIIPEQGAGPEAVSLAQGIRDSRIKDKWQQAILAARFDVLSPAQAVAAAVRGNLSYEAAQALAAEAGISLEHFGTMYHNAGNPPSLGELLELYKRGKIPLTGTGPDVLSVEQGVHEGDTKNKWFPAVGELAVYLPPPRTITAMLREGAIAKELAARLLKDQGVDEELVPVYIEAASKGSSATSKELTKSEVLQLYADAVISAATATADLVKLGLSETDAKELVTLQDAKRDRQLSAQVISRIRSLYVKREITEQEATTALRDVGQDQAEITHLLSLWDLERGVPVAHLTGPEIASGVFYEVLSVDEGLAGLRAIGYSAFEAWLALAVRLHGAAKLPPRPPLPAWSG